MSRLPVLLECIMSPCQQGATAELNIVLIVWTSTVEYELYFMLMTISLLAEAANRNIDL